MSEGTTRPDVSVLPDLESLAEAAARMVAQTARDAIAEGGMFRVALSGGSTPEPMYERLAAPPLSEEIDWSRVQVFFSDERFVPPTSTESNYHTAYQALLSKVPIPARFVHRYATEDITPDDAASIYQEALRRVFQVGMTHVPRFDLILLGMGADGHTASLFPDTEALGAFDSLVVANFVPRLDDWRLTFTFPVINVARRVAFLVAGEDKAEAVGRVFGGDASLPAARVRPSPGELLWFLDKAAAADLPADAGAGSTRPAGAAGEADGTEGSHPVR